VRILVDIYLTLYFMHMDDRMRQVCDHPLLVVGKSESAENLKDGPIQLEELLAKFSGDGDNPEVSFGASVLHSLKTGAVAECPVCLEDMDGGVLLPCMHAACRGCVVEYLQAQDDAGKKGECPICRHGPITEDDLIEYTTTEVKTETKSEVSDVMAGNVLGGGHQQTNGGGSERVVQIRRNNFKSSSKLDALMGHLNRIRKESPRTKSVVFSQFTGMLDLAEGCLERDGFEFLRLDGTHSQASREKTLQAFKDPDHPALVVLISLRAGGVGLNLTAASHVYMLVSMMNARGGLDTSVVSAPLTLISFLMII
jgi:DNA repair protein RAD5